MLVLPSLGLEHWHGPGIWGGNRNKTEHVPALTIVNQVLDLYLHESEASGIIRISNSALWLLFHETYLGHPMPERRFYTFVY